MAAAAAAAFVHPITDRDVAKIHRPKHDGSDATWQPFTYEVEVYADDIDAGYVLEIDAVQRGNLVAALGHVPLRIQTDQNRIYSMLKFATASYAAPEIEQVNRGAADCGSDLWRLLSLRARAGDPTARVSRKEDLFRYVEHNFKHDTFDAFFDHVQTQRNIINAMGAGAGLMDDEQLVSGILSGVSRDSRYAAATEAIALLPAPPTLPVLRDNLKRRWRNIESAAASKKVSDAIHALEERSKCQYPGCGSTKHDYSSCPLKSADLKLRREAEAVRRGKTSKGKDKGGRDEVCTYKPCGKKGHSEARCFMKKRDEKAKAEAKAEKKKKKTHESAANVEEAGADDEADMLCMMFGEVCDEDLEESIMVDTGTSCHITNKRERLINIRPCSKILGGVGAERLHVGEVGDMPVRVKREAPDGKVSYPRMLFRDTYLVPTANKPLVSMKRAKAHGFKASFDDDGPEGFTDRQGNFYPFIVGSMGLSYLLVKYDLGASEEPDTAMIMDVRDPDSDVDPDTESDASSDSDGPPSLLDSDSDSDSDDDDEPPALCSSDSESDDDDAGEPAVKVEAPPLSAAGKLSASQRRAIDAANDDYYQKLALKYHVKCGHTNINYLRSVAASVDGLEELQQLPAKFKMKPLYIPTRRGTCVCAPREDTAMQLRFSAPMVLER